MPDVAKESDLTTVALNRVGAVVPDAKKSAMQDRIAFLTHLDALGALGCRISKSKFMELIRQRATLLGISDVISQLEPQQQAVVASAKRLTVKEVP